MATFQVVCGSTKFGETVKVVGSAPELGSWQTEQAVELKTDPSTFPLWKSGTVCLDSCKLGDKVEYKYITCAGESKVEWENFVGNRWFNLREGECLVADEGFGIKNSDESCTVSLVEVCKLGDAENEENERAESVGGSTKPTSEKESVGEKESEKELEKDDHSGAASHDPSSAIDGDLAEGIHVEDSKSVDVVGQEEQEHEEVAPESEAQGDEGVRFAEQPQPTTESVDPTEPVVDPTEMEHPVEVDVAPAPAPGVGAVDDEAESAQEVSSIPTSTNTSRRTSSEHGSKKSKGRRKKSHH